MGLVWVPRAKAVRAIAQAQVAAQQAMTAADYRSLLGFLEHLRRPMGVRRELMDYLWSGLYRATGEELDVGDTVELDGRACGYLRKWISVLANRPGHPVLGPGG